MIVSTGAGVAVPFFVFGWLRGIPTVYLEVYDRIDSPTLTGRLCRPFTRLFCVQWEDQRKFYPGSRRRGPAACERAGAGPRRDRLPPVRPAGRLGRPLGRRPRGRRARAARDLPAARGRPPASRTWTGTRCSPRSPQADVVVTHGGPATISEARNAGHRPIVVPRDPSPGRARRRPPAAVLPPARRERAGHGGRGRAGAAGRARRRRPRRARSGARCRPRSLPTTRRLGALVDGLLPAGATTPPAPERPRIAFLGGSAGPARRCWSGCSTRSPGSARSASRCTCGSAGCATTSAAAAASRSPAARTGRRSARPRSAAGTSSTSTTCSR